MLQEPAARGAELVVFRSSRSRLLPALGISPTRSSSRSSSATCPARYAALFDEAKRLVSVPSGLRRADLDGHRYNTRCSWSATAASSRKYRKVHLPGHEIPESWRRPASRAQVLRPGSGIVRGAGRVRWSRRDPAICNDRRWPETYRVLGLQGVELILIGYNTPIHYAPVPGSGSSRRVPQQPRDGLGRVPRTRPGSSASPRVGGRRCRRPRRQPDHRAVRRGRRPRVHEWRRGRGRGVRPRSLQRLQADGLDFDRYRRPEMYTRITGPTGKKRREPTPT